MNLFDMDELEEMFNKVIVASSFYTTMQCKGGNEDEQAYPAICEQVPEEELKQAYNDHDEKLAAGEQEQEQEQEQADDYDQEQEAEDTAAAAAAVNKIGQGAVWHSCKTILMLLIFMLSFQPGSGFQAVSKLPIHTIRYPDCSA